MYGGGGGFKNKQAVINCSVGFEKAHENPWGNLHINAQSYILPLAPKLTCV